jgi:hypothetical protein
MSLSALLGDGMDHSEDVYDGVASRGKSATSGLSEPLFGYFDRVVPKGGREVRAANATKLQRRVAALDMTVASSQDCMGATPSMAMSTPLGQEARTKYIKYNLESSKHLPNNMRSVDGFGIDKASKNPFSRIQMAEIKMARR